MLWLSQSNENLDLINTEDDELVVDDILNQYEESVFVF